MTLNNKHILVTGGAGFIGSNLIAELLKQNNTVCCLDNLATGRKSNIEPFLNNPAFSFIEGDIRDAACCSEAAKGKDIVLHQAALGSVPRSVKDPVTSTEVNTMGFVNMLTAAKDANVKRFVYASSSSVYGDNSNSKKIEAETGSPLSPYAVTKATNELFAKNFSRVYGIETAGLRYFNVYGRNQDPNGAYAAVIPKFILQMIKGERPTINNSDGSYSRDFTFIDNVVSANLLAAAMPLPDGVDPAFNVACGRRVTLDELFYSIRKHLSLHQSNVADFTPVYGCRRAGDIPHSLADISKSEQYLNYQVLVNFDDGIKETVNWYWDNKEKFL